MTSSKSKKTDPNNVPQIVYALQNSLSWLRVEEFPEEIDTTIKTINSFVSNGYDLTKEFNGFIMDENKIIRFPNFLFFLMKFNCPLKVLKHVLSSCKFDINAEDEQGNTILWDAIQTCNRKSIVSYLIKNGINVRHKNKIGATPLFVYHYMRERTNIKNANLISQLIDAGLDVNAKDTNGETALTCAVKYTKNIDLISLLTQKGYDFSQINPVLDDAVNKLYTSGYATLNKRINDILKDYITKDALVNLSELLISEDKSNQKKFWQIFKMDMLEDFLKKFPNEQETLLESAIENNVDFDFIKEILLKKKRKCCYRPAYILYCAITNHHWETANFIMSNLVSGETLKKEGFGFSYFKRIMDGSDLKAVKFLVENNIINLKPSQMEENPLEICTNLEVIKYLIQKGVPLPQYIPVDADLDAMNFYIQQGVNVDAPIPNKDGMSPLMEISRRGSLIELDLKRLKLLLDNGADVNKKDESGKTPLLHYITSSAARKCFHYVSGSVDFLNILMRYNPDTSVTDNEGKTAFQYFIEDWKSRCEEHEIKSQIAKLLYTKKNSSRLLDFYYYFLTRDEKNTLKLLDNKEIQDALKDYHNPLGAWEIVESFANKKEVVKKLLDLYKPDFDCIFNCLCRYCSNPTILDEMLKLYPFELTSKQLLRACTSENYQIAKYLIEKGVRDFDEQAETTCLIAASQNLNAELSKLLLDNGANINQKDTKYKENALQHALTSWSNEEGREKHVENFIEFLLHYKPKLCKDGYGRTTLDIAAENASIHVMKMILNYDNSETSKKKLTIEKTLCRLQQAKTWEAGVPDNIEEKMEFLRQKLAELNT